MKKTNILGKLYRFCEWVVFLSWLNILWILFTLVGLVLFGWAPAIAAAYALLNKSLEEHTIKLPTIKSFFGEYKKYFFRANGIGYSILIIGLYFVFILFTLPDLPKALFIILSIIFGALGSMFIITSLYSFPVLIHNDSNYIKTIKMSLFMGIANLNHIFLIGCHLIMTYLLFMVIPGSMIFLLVSLPIFIIAIQANKSFERIIEMGKKEGLNNG